MSYDSYQFLYPPRPETLIAPIAWPRGCVQVKKNGHCCVIAVRGDEIIVRTRHNCAPQWRHKVRFGLKGGWHVFCGELLKDRYYLFDALVIDGQYLLGADHWERQVLLHQCLGVGRIRATLEVAMNYWDPQEAARTLVDGEDEGLVFRMPDIDLTPCVTPRANAAGLYKWRRK